jgi:hypothetical protein
MMPGAGMTSRNMLRIGPRLRSVAGACRRAVAAASNPDLPVAMVRDVPPFRAFFN